LIPHGTFIRGHDAESSADAKPQRNIFVSAVYIDITEVTNSQYEKYDPYHKRNPSSLGDNMPVTNVTWYEAVKYCAWRSKKTGARYRLPTEAEWEKAAKGGRDLPFSWGKVFNRKNGCAARNSETTVPVKSYDPNPYGLYNMSGNVWEWCSDWYNKDYYEKSPDKNPSGPPYGIHKVVRGGSFRFNVKMCRTFERNAEKPDKSDLDIGFRTVRVIPAAEAPRKPEEKKE
jgi:formylglycine-generating enzyme required for sulfatase activity